MGDMDMKRIALLLLAISLAGFSQYASARLAGWYTSSSSPVYATPELACRASVYISSYPDNNYAGYTYFNFKYVGCYCHSNPGRPDCGFAVLYSGYYITADVKSDGSGSGQNVDPGKTKGKACPCEGDPIDPGTGNEFETEPDYSLPDAQQLKFTRYYNSGDQSAGILGAGWRDNYARHLTPEYVPSPPSAYAGPPGESNLYRTRQEACEQGWKSVKAEALAHPYYSHASYEGTTCVVYNGNYGEKPVRVGTVELYYAPTGIPIPNAEPIAWTATRADGKVYRFRKTADGWQADADVNIKLVSTADGFRLTDENDNVELYNAAGRLISVTDRVGRTQVMGYDSSGRLTSVRGAFGSELLLNYSNGHLATVTEPGGGVIAYEYDAQDNLTHVTFPDGTARQYLYEDANYPHALTGIVDEDGNRFASWQYDAQGRATLNERAGGAGRIQLDYSDALTTTVTEPLGAIRTYHFDVVQGVPKPASVDMRACSTCAAKTEYFTWDANGRLASQTDYAGHQTTYGYDGRGLQTSRTEAAGSAQARTISTDWDPTFRLPVRVTEPGKVTTYQYDSRGLIQARTNTDSATGAARVTSYGYDARGLLTSIDGPRTDINDVTSFAYDSAGNISTITNALGQTTQIIAYTADGWPLTIIDPNGIETDLTYDARGRLLTRTVAGATTHFAYDAAGQLKKVTLPTGSYLAYTYDAAHRLTAIDDSLGNRLAFTLDALGNCVEEDDRDAQGIVRRSVKRVYDQLNHLSEVVGGAGQISQYSYDKVDNLTSATDPLGNVTHQTFDALNRLVVTVDPMNGETSFNRDAQNHLDDVTDPRGLNTHYDHDAFGDVVGRDSPDTGYTAYTYDAAGNRITKTDARGVTTTYTYDALNRLTSIQYPDSSKNVTYTYDQGTYGIGHRTGMQDSSGTTTYAYDARGNRVHKTTTVDGHTFELAYAYDLSDQLTGVTYPDGMQVKYQRDATGRVVSVHVIRNGVSQALADNVSYEPFGPMTALTYGNGLTESRTYDKAYRLTGIDVPGVMQWSLTDDANDNITNIADALNSGDSQTFTYDPLNRLATAQGSYASQSYHYDLDGNRTSLTEAGTVESYSYGSASNRLLTAGTQPFQYDAAGNTVSDGLHTYTYDVTNRLTGYDDKPDVYLYNGLGQRVRKPIPVKPGDANGDGIIDQNDLLSLQDGLKGNTNLSAGMDCNQDGVIDNKDKSCIANQIGTTKNHGKGKGVQTATVAAASTTTTSAGTVLYQYMIYDEAGHLLGEYDENGNMIQEHIWLGNRPLGVASDNGLFYVTTDQIGTPRVITNASQQLVWRWGSDPFGNGQPDENPSGAGLFSYNLRFPGQYYDAETGRNYNYFRDYDSGIGRYVESDPIGLGGGINGYIYSLNGPVNGFDPLGEYCLSHRAINGISGFVAGAIAGAAAGHRNLRMAVVGAVVGGIAGAATAYFQHNDRGASVGAAFMAGALSNGNKIFSGGAGGIVAAGTTAYIEKKGLPDYAAVPVGSAVGGYLGATVGAFPTTTAVEVVPAIVKALRAGGTGAVVGLASGAAFIGTRYLLNKENDCGCGN